MIRRTIKKLAGERNRQSFASVASKVRDTAPLTLPYREDLVFVSQVYHNAMDMSLLALKSFAKFMPAGRFELIDDGSLTSDDYAVLKQHLVNVNITHIDTIALGECPKGGCWERLIHIIELSKNAYVVQVDTDTLTIGPLPEVFNFIANNQAFTIGNPMWPEAVPTEYMSAVARAWKGTHVQVKTEEQLDALTSIELNHYLRGCAAFTGFPKGSFDIASLNALSVELEQKIGQQKWHEWGSEQVSSNIMVSMCDNARVLPWPKYMNFGFPETGLREIQDYKGKVSLIHFIGSNRFDGRVYEEFVSEIV